MRKYVEEHQHVNQDDEPTFFDEFDGKALEEQMELQVRVAAYAKKAKRKEIPRRCSGSSTTWSTTRGSCAVIIISSRL